MSNQITNEMTTNDGLVKEVLNTAAEFAQVGTRIEELKDNASRIVEDGINDAKRIVKRGRHAAEDIIEDTAHMIKHDPFGSVGVTFGVGFGLGAIVGLLIAYKLKAT